MRESGPTGAAGAAGASGPTGAAGQHERLDRAARPAGPSGSRRGDRTGRVAGPARCDRCDRGRRDERPRAVYGAVYNVGAQVVPMEADITFEQQRPDDGGHRPRAGNRVRRGRRQGACLVTFTVSGVEPSQMNAVRERCAGVRGHLRLRVPGRSRAADRRC